MSSITDNPTDPTRENPDDADWARWEETFRDAKPVLPEAAMARIEASIRREAERAAALPRRSRLRLWIVLLVSVLIIVNVGVLWMLNRERGGTDSPSKAAIPPHASLVQDHYSMEVMIGPPLVAPDRPILPLAENADLFDYKGENAALLDIVPKEKPPAAQPAPSVALMKGAERLCAGSLDSWRQLGLLEMCRVAGTPAPKVALFPPHDQEYHIVAAWRMLPLHANNAAAFGDEIQRISAGKTTADGEFWMTMYLMYLRQFQKGSPVAGLADPRNGQPTCLPAKLGDRARFDLLVELGEPRAQAALDVLTTRSYRALATVRAYQSWDKRPANFIIDFAYVSHDLVDRLFALRLAGRNDDALKLLQDALKIPYLNDPADLAVLLARLGPDDAWEKVLKPLMDDEVAFIEKPPTFDQSEPRALPDAIVEAAGKSVANGITTYAGPNVKLLAGPWRINCNSLSAYHNDQHGMLLSGSGTVRVEGVIGLLSATADQATFNTATGDLKLAGRVHLDGWTAVRDVKSCTINRSGELREEVRGEDGR